MNVIKLRNGSEQILQFLEMASLVNIRFIVT